MLKASDLRVSHDKPLHNILTPKVLSCCCPTYLQLILQLSGGSIKADHTCLKSGSIQPVRAEFRESLDACLTAIVEQVQPPTSSPEPSYGSARSSGPLNRTFCSTTCMPSDFHSFETLAAFSSAVSGTKSAGDGGAVGTEGTGGGAAGAGFPAYKTCEQSQFGHRGHDLIRIQCWQARSSQHLVETHTQVYECWN